MFVRVVHTLLCLCFLAGPCTCISPCLAQDSPAGVTDNQTLQVSFLSLKPGSSIAPATLRLRSDGTLEMSIANESLTGARGEWSMQGNRFSVSTKFTVDRRPLFHYRLVLDGFGVMGRYAGRARLLEYDRQDRLMQDIGFLFYAEAPGTRPVFGKDTAP